MTRSTLQGPTRSERLNRAGMSIQPPCWVRMTWGSKESIIGEDEKENLIPLLIRHSMSSDFTSINQSLLQVQMTTHISALNMNLKHETLEDNWIQTLNPVESIALLQSERA